MRRFDEAWRSGATPRLEDYLVEGDALDRDDILRELVLVEIEQLSGRGAVVADESEYAARFPAGGEAVRAAFANFRARGGEEAARFAGRLARSGLLPEEEVRRLRTTAASRGNSTAERFASALIFDGVLSSWQTESLRRGDEQRLVIGHYRLLEKLGEGGMGVVYRASHTLIDRSVALKRLRPDLSRKPAAVQRFLKEAQACVRLQHPNIVSTYDVGEEGGVVYLTMEIIDGEDLDRLVTRRGPLPTGEAISIVVGALQGLEYAHHRGIVHRDVTPRNLMVDRGGNVRLLDLGLARVIQEPAAASGTMPGLTPQGRDARGLAPQRHGTLTRSGLVLGTVLYMSPEQMQDPRRADERSDIYSLGCVLYFLLTGKHAFEGESIEEVCRKRIAGPPLSRLSPQVPDHLKDVLRRMMAPDSRARYAGAADVRAALLENCSTPIPVASEPRPDKVAQLGKTLVELGLVQEDDWEQVVSHASAFTGPANSPEQHTRVMRLRPPATPDDPHSALLSLRETAEDGGRGITPFQFEQILAGNAHRLRLPHHVILERREFSRKGEIFLARHLPSGRVDVIRTFGAMALRGLEGTESERLNDFVAAAARRAAVEHPSVPEVTDFGIHNGIAYLAEKRIVGDSLHRIFPKLSVFPKLLDASVSWALDCAIQCASALAQAHIAGVYHGDLGLHQVRIQPGGRVFVFGIGIGPLILPKPDSIQGGSTRVHWGRTPGRFAPEREWGRSTISASSDVYELALLILQLVSRDDLGLLRHAFPHEEGEYSPLNHERVSSLFSRLPGPLRPALDKALSQVPEDRHPSAVELLEDLGAARAELRSGARPLEDLGAARAELRSRARPFASGVGRFRDPIVLVLYLSLLGLVLLAGTWLLFWRR